MNLSDVPLDDVEPSTGFDAIPAGKYKVVVSASEEKQTKKGDGSYLKLTFTVLEGPYQNRRLWAQLNLNNPSEQAVAIARSELKSLVVAAGLKSNPRDSSELHDLPIVIRVSQKLDQASGEFRNEIKRYEPTGGQIAKPPTATPGGGGGAPKAPWKK